MVRERAGQRCEYCRLPQHAVDGVLQVEHIVARQHRGGDHAENLALACDRCNLCKGPNLSGIDPQTGMLTALFNPRTAAWDDHFELSGAIIVGKSPIGRATVQVLQVNARQRVRLRAHLLALGEF
jgi:hypothetical protein